MSNVVIIIQIMFITIGMTILRIGLNYVLGLRKENLSELRKKALNLQERIRNAQVLGDYQLLAQTQQESVQFMKLMMKKQFFPMCISCSVFMGIFAVLLFIYADYASGLLPIPILIFGNGWVAIYFIFSIGFSLIIYGVKKLYKKVTGKETKTQSSLREIMSIVSPTRQNMGLSFFESSSSQNQLVDEDSKSKDSWKQRIEE
ncbi:MAG: hypothetical protein ACFE9Q_10095 [Candidatus Hodarchaeota archaeon]